MPFDIPGHRNRTPFCVEGAAPGMRVVTALTIVEVVGPRETEPPQLSARDVPIMAAATAVWKSPEQCIVIVDERETLLKSEDVCCLGLR